jgi:hypothetical protein
MNQIVNLKVTAILLSFALLLGLTAPTWAEDAPEPVENCAPMAVWLAETMEVDCEDLMALHAEGVGFGQIMMAWRLSQSLPDYEGSWEDLLASHLEGEGWGQTMMAYRFAAAFDADPEEMLALKQSGMGWGQIGHAHALANADLGLSFDDAVAMLQSGMSWGEIRDELGLPPGPPPWAGRPEWAGTPPWAGPPGADDNGGPGGPPPWAGPPGRADNDDRPGGGPPPWAGSPGGPNNPGGGPPGGRP